MIVAIWVKRELEDLRLRLTLSQLRVSASDTMAGTGDARIGGPNSCCIYR